eukprot:gnl/Carplike_NY0171/6919_a9539_185.p1 GENE.gnl/Carplike_NY0171/6919_a9539_185~~gnl/Carplike_NY0171/6919_a9539_185.p1  ORF type:complete len:260 (+),score=20.13 gnl/Carplike_NY0171/6919_a9539_185:104-781(+)
METRYTLLFVFIGLVCAQILETYMKMSNELKLYEFNEIAIIIIWFVEIVLYIASITLGFISTLCLCLNNDSDGNYGIHAYMGPLRFTFQLIFCAIEGALMKKMSTTEGFSNGGRAFLGFLAHLVLSYGLYTCLNLFVIPHLVDSEAIFESGASYVFFMFRWICPLFESVGMLFHNSIDNDDSSFGTFLSDSCALRRLTGYYYIHYFLIDYISLASPILIFVICDS